ncbi:MAG: hypothetical protein PHU59_01465 [Candidatus Omnitrophica bacterium]|jgi:hypothetical protein|nr:hypothetical protein [Candidatus Omnitrophota bacterium]
MKTKPLPKFIINLLVFCLAIAFVIKFGGPNILRQYIAYGIGECKNIPILCMQPEEKLFAPVINPEYLTTLVLQKFPRMSISAPKGFTLVQELVKKVYYKKRHANNQAVIYLLRQDPFAFIKLYPDVRKQGVKDNYEFIRRLQNANLGKIKNITDAFFVIMKSVFTPDIGNQGSAKMIRFTINDKSGYINYTLTQSNNYFDCNLLDADDNFFKVYIKDTSAQLDLNKVYAILSTIKPVN